MNEVAQLLVAGTIDFDDLDNLESNASPESLRQLGAAAALTAWHFENPERSARAAQIVQAARTRGGVS